MLLRSAVVVRDEAAADELAAHVWEVVRTPLNEMSTDSRSSMSTEESSVSSPKRSDDVVGQKRPRS